MCLGVMPSNRYELALVMPVYNEEGCIAAVVDSWRAELEVCGIDFVLIVIDDGSRDRTARILADYADDERIRVSRQTNDGHGPAVLRGYRQAVAVADWVFQCDSDDEMRPDSFQSLWKLRDEADAVFGCRQHRRQGLQRRLISLCSRVTMEKLYGRGVEDANTPYRLMRSSVLEPIIACIPPRTAAPNVIVSGALIVAAARIRNVPVPCLPRQTGRGSMVRWRLWKTAIRSFGQTLRCSRQIRRVPLRQQHAAETLAAPRER